MWFFVHGTRALRCLVPYGAALLVCLGCPAGDTMLVPALIDVRALAPGESRFYRAELNAGDVLHLRIEQRGLDVEIRAGDRPPIDLPYGDRVPEELWWQTEQSGRLRVEVRSLGGSGDYRLMVEQMGPATKVDQRRTEAFWLAQEGAAARSESPETAIPPLTAALERLRGTTTPIREALTWSELGGARLESGDRESAEAAFDEAVALVDRLAEPALAGRLIHARGRAFRRAWKLERAAADYIEAQGLLERTEDVYGQILVINDLAVLSDVRGDLKTACDGYERAGHLFSELGSARGTATARLNLGRCLMKVGAMPRALPVLLDALRETKSLTNAAELRAAVLREIGWWYRLQRQPDRALSFLKAARELHPLNSAFFDRLATVHLDRGELGTARALYSEALTGARGDRLGEAHVRTNLCRLEELASRLGEERAHGDHVVAGLEQCRRALSVFDAVGAAGTSATVLFLAAKLERRRGRLATAESLAGQALSRIESQRPLAGETEDRTAFLAERQEFYRLLIDLRMELHEQEPVAGWDARALEVYELTRARGLLDLLANEKVDPSLRVSPELRHAERDLADRVDVRTRDLLARAWAEGQPEAGAEAELAALEAELATLRRRLQSVEPSYVALTQPRPLDVAAIQAMLDGDTLLLAIHLGERRGLLWTVDRQKVTGRWLESSADLQRSAEAWYGLLADPGQRRIGDQLERRRARRLSEKLLLPIADELARHRRLVVVSDGAFQRLPFGALPSPRATSAEDRPLIVDHEVVQLPSVAVLAVLRQIAGRHSEARKLLAIVADPLYEPTDERLGAAAVATLDPTSYRRLGGAADEAEDLVALAGAARASVLQGFDARRDRILAGALAGFRIVHFATHARTDVSPGRPLGLLLSRLDENGQPIADVLGLPELYTLELPADLVILSGCATAIGQEVEGEGLMGLTRGFIHAGTPRVVVSLWNVRDQAARELMRRFYRSLLQDRHPPGEALRRAQVGMRADGWEVRDWAAFVLHGDWRPFSLATEPRTDLVVKGDNKVGAIGSK